MLVITVATEGKDQAVLVITVATEGKIRLCLL